MFLWTPQLLLVLLCVIFYAALQYYTHNTLNSVGQVSVALLDKLLALRMFLSGLFCLLLGYMGVKLSGQVWPAVLIHCLVVIAILCIDLSPAQIIAHWDITLLILSAVAALTGVAGGLTLGLFWLRMRYPAFFWRKKS